MRTDRKQEEPATAAWASPSWAGLSAQAQKQAQVPGPGTRFHAYTVASRRPVHTAAPSKTPPVLAHDHGWPPAPIRPGSTTGFSVPPMVPYEPDAMGDSSVPAGVPVFDGDGGQVGVVIANPAAGTVELVGPGDAVLGRIEQQDGAIYLVGTDGAVAGTFSLDQATSRVILSAGGATAPDGTTTTAVPVFDTNGLQLGLALVNPATGAVELAGLNGTVLGVIVQPRASAAEHGYGAV